MTLTNWSRWRGAIAEADAVIVGSYVPEGVAVGATWCSDRPRHHRLL